MRLLLPICLLSLTLSTSLFSQEFNCESILFCEVSAPSGLRMRAEPTLTGKSVMIVPAKAKLESCSETYGTLTVEGIEGNWRKVLYEEKVGFMFDGFLRVLQVEEAATSQATDSAKVEVVKPFVREYSLLTEAYNYCGDVSAINPSLVWYGVYPSALDATMFDIRQIDLQIVLSKFRNGDGLEFDISTGEESGAIFLVGTNRAADWENANIMDRMDMISNGRGKLFPGQSLWLSARQAQLIASGSYSANTDCPEIAEYHIEFKDAETQQDLTLYLVNKDQCGLPDLYWFGDLNNDQMPELIFTYRLNNDDVFKLFISDSKNKNEPYKIASTWKVAYCP